jgi:hypothetical protein
MATEHHWSFSNIFNKVSLKRFSSLAKAFQESASNAFDTEMKLSWRAYGSVETGADTTVFVNDEVNALVKKGSRDLLKSSDRLEDLTADVWHSARRVEVRLSPANPLSGPEDAFGQMEYKDTQPKDIAFHLIGGEADYKTVRTATDKEKPLLSVNNKPDSHFSFMRIAGRGNGNGGTYFPPPMEVK